MIAQDNGDIKERIDTNKDYIINIDEINNFIFDDKKGNNNLNELGNYLNGLSILQSNNDIIKRALMGYFMSKEWSDESKKIGNKVKANQPLEKRELSLLYLQMIDIYSRTGNKYQCNFDPNKPASGELLAFIKRQYNNQSYNPQAPKSDAQKFQDNQRKDKFGFYTKESATNVEIPQIPELSENNENYVYNYCYRLIEWAEKNFANEVTNIRYNARAEHYDQSKEDIPEYARYDILLFAYEKYCEAISNNNEKLIKQAGYKDSKDFERQMDELQKIGEEISQKFPNLEEALNTLQRFGEEVENNKKKYFNSDEEVEKAGKDSEEFNQFLEAKAKEYKIDEVKASFEKDPETSKEAQEYCEGINKIIEYQEEVSQKTKSYGDSIEKYQKYMQGNLEISQKYSSINEYMEVQKEYSEFIKEWGNKIDFNKYEQYEKLREESGIDKDFHNMSILGKIIMNPQDEHFPILGVKNAADEKQKKIDAFRNNLQNKSGTAYRLLTSLSGLANGFLSATVNVGTSLGYMILSLCGKDKAELDKRKKFRDDLDINLSSKQKESVYNPDTHSINLNRHNGITTVSSSIAQMLVLINGGGVMAKGLKGIGVAEGIASKAGLFGMSFITQVGQSYQEASNQGLNGGKAFSYSMLSATVQSALELVSPNEILLGKGSGITKELIRNIVKDGSKNSFMMLGKAFLKNVGMEIVEENIQEALQLSAGNLINMYADNKWGSELGADWSWQNFAQTAIITTLTTGITTGTSYMSQLTNMSDNDHRTLFTKVINNEGTYTAVMEMLNKAIHGEIKIPGTDITSLEKLRTAFLSVNNIGSNLHEVWRETQLNEDGTYKEKIETTQDETWIEQHDGQTEVDIANTTFENLPSDWQRENLEAAKVAESLVFDALVKGEEITPEMIEEMSREVHEEWRKRNPGEKSGAWDIPYDQLPESEKVKDRNQVILAIETTRQNLQNDYFNGKSHKFNVSESQAHANSSNMDKILSEINERNKSQKLEDLRNEICTQYETATKEKIELTDEQLQSILDAHEQDGILGELTTGQLKQKVEILDKTITDPNVRRFLLEAGFCGSYANMLQAAQDFYQKNSEIINNSIDFVGKSINNAYKSSKRQNRKEYEIGEEVDIPRYDGSITHGAHIQSYDPRTGTYLVVRYQNGKYAEKYVSTEELDSINGSTTEISEISQTTKGYSVGQEINIIKKDGNIGKAKITEFNEIHGLYRTEWNENGKSKFYYFTKEELDNANPNHIGTEYVESHEIKESTNSRRKEMADVRRISDVIAIGDLHGEYIALKGNLEYAGLAKETNGHLQWTGGNKRVVFQGDILSDRGTDGLKIIKEIYQLRQQAQSQGGDINIIVGNHDDFMISYLTGRNGIHEDGINISIGDWAGGINNGQGRGILELARDFYTGKPPRLKNGLYDFKKILKNGHENILNNMRESPEGRIILEEICNMKPVLQIDDVLYCHTNPTQGMLQYLTNGNIQDNINMLNQKYQGYLRKVLLGEGGQTISTKEFNEISDLFLNTDNRDIGGIEKYAEVLKNSGINMISHGHSGGNGRRNGQYVYDNNKVDINGLKIVDTDFSYGKHGKTGGKEHSISVTEQNGGKIIMGDDAHYIEQKGKNSDYFGGKPHKFNVTESQARSNSLNMDRILNDMNEQNKPEMLQQLREEINKQHKESTGQELLLTDEQLLSILDAHEQDGILGELTTGQLKHKVKILSETITDPNVRRFLLEAGFCGMEFFDDSLVQDTLTDPFYTLEYESLPTEEYDGQQDGNPRKIDDLQENWSGITLDDSLSPPYTLSDIGTDDGFYGQGLSHEGQEVEYEYIDTKDEAQNNGDDQSAEESQESTTSEKLLDFLDKANDFLGDLKDFRESYLDDKNFRKFKKMERKLNSLKSSLNKIISNFKSKENIEYTIQESKTLIEKLEYLRINIELILEKTHPTDENQFFIDTLNSYLSEIRNRKEELQEYIKKENIIYKDEDISTNPNDIDVVVEEVVEKTGFIQNYAIGQEVNVPRSDGSITHGAYIESFDPSTGKYLVKRYQNGTGLQKRVSTEQLNSVNQITKTTTEDLQIQLNYNPDYVHYKGDGIFWFDTNETESSNESKYQSAQESESSINKLIGHNDNISKEEKDALKEEETKIKTQGWFVEGHKIEDYEKDADIFIEQAKEMEIAHKQIFLDIAKEAGAKALFIGPPKSKERIVEKVRDEYLKQNRGLEAITDFTRSTVLFDSFSDFERGIRVLMDLKAKGTISEFTIKNRLTKTGCNDVMVNIKTKDGYVSEMQFHVPEVLIFRDGYLGAKTIELYTGLTEHRLTKDIFDLGDEKYTKNLEAYNRIIDRLNEGREKKLSLPKEQGQIVHDHDMYDIIRVLEKYEKMDELGPDDYQLFTSKGVTLENIKNLIDDLKKMKENLCKEALDWHGQRAQ